MLGMRRVGLTGGIGSGKSTVARLLADHGATIIDADVLAREAVAPGTAGLQAVVDRFGPDILRPTGDLDREALGRIVFNDPDARTDLNAIVHPWVRNQTGAVRASALAADPQAVVVEVIPLLVETGQAEDFDEVIVVDVPVETQIARVRSRSGLSEPEIRSRIEAQASREARLAAATIVVDNTGDLADLASAVQNLLPTLGLRVADTSTGS
ncbi:MAG: dephospho-CoA kinase [Propioniciclava sp.]